MFLVLGIKICIYAMVARKSRECFVATLNIEREKDKRNIPNGLLLRLTGGPPVKILAVGIKGVSARFWCKGAAPVPPIKHGSNCGSDSSGRKFIENNNGSDSLGHRRLKRGPNIDSLTQLEASKRKIVS